MKAKQLFLLAGNTSTEHGGDSRIGKRKVYRPLDSKRPLHVVLRASRAKGPLSLLDPHNVKKVSGVVAHAAQRFHIRVYNFVNVGNHIHFLVKIPNRENFQNFLRYITGRIAMLVGGGKKGCALGRFWDKLAYTRIVSWGKEWLALKTYMVKNTLESRGLSRKDPNFNLYLKQFIARVGPPTALK